MRLKELDISYEIMHTLKRIKVKSKAILEIDL
jgi:hypothetical protein